MATGASASDKPRAGDRDEDWFGGDVPIAVGSPSWRPSRRREPARWAYQRPSVRDRPNIRLLEVSTARCPEVVGGSVRLHSSTRARSAEARSRARAAKPFAV